ncbi:hypothetical protein [Caenimonas aquaedulcis]|uniref:Uncharacterized protein n=1 Tax=Caenimonas aquaedulcis TaxID=2793270 RepID=A0A931H5G6_9BURK|nr:hypothetical protein [Caenimonas aquaedulcis]MBG9388903.1 hypothetical protein [Caenimonas aquaedulcis]
MFKWFATAEAERFGKELAQFILAELSGSARKREAKFAVRAEKILIRADLRVREFRAREPLNFYKKSKLANAFLWALKDGGCDEAYLTELTDWLTIRL